MILLILILIPLAGGLLSWLTGKRNAGMPRIISLIAVAVDMVLALTLISMERHGGMEGMGAWIVDFSAEWIPAFGISFHLALDGLSLLLLLLTLFLGLLAIIVSWNEKHERTGFFHFNLLWALSGIMGVFLAMDLFLFYFFWELMIVPMYFLIGIWGNRDRTYASSKFFLYTQASGLLMFVAILALYFIHGRNTGIYTFNYEELVGTSMAATTAWLLMLGFLAAFLVKLAVLPFHNWQPDAYTEAPTAGTLILAGIMLKTGAYGLIRFVVPLFPEASVSFAPAGMLLGVAGILYGAKLAFAQTDLKRLIAYTSISHMGFVMLGVYAFNTMAYQGVVMQLIAHAISTGALFILAGQLQERMNTREIGKMGGLWNQAPVMGAMGLIFALASLGLPGLGNFIAEFLILAGAFKANVLMTCLACLGLVAAAIYSLRIVQKIFLGKEKSEHQISDLTLREKLVFGSLVLIILYLGLFPQRVIDAAEPAVSKTLSVFEKDIHTTNAEIKQDNKLTNYTLYDRN
jgi:NADH-quinone oxidoreductase subunit M